MTGNGTYDSHLHVYCYTGLLCYNSDYKLVFIGLSLDLTMNKFREIHLHIAFVSVPVSAVPDNWCQKRDVLRREDERRRRQPWEQRSEGNMS